jgi:proline dehydrogenase
MSNTGLLRAGSPQGTPRTRIPFFARRFVSGTTAAEAITVAERLKQKKILSTIDLLGENISEPAETRNAAAAYTELVQLMASRGIEPYISVKLTMLGLDQSADLCAENLSQVLRTADEHKGRVCMDMEGSAYTERTIAMYEWACKHYHSPEVVLQAYLHRTREDTERILKANGRLRLCKGAYKERPEVALQNMRDIRKNYLEILETLLKRSSRVCIASHDDHIIKHALSLLERHSVPKERYEFQMLYGLRQKTWGRLAANGHNMTVYVPYGEHWQAYYSRRLAERKENVFFILRTFFQS